MKKPSLTILAAVTAALALAACADMKVTPVNAVSDTRIMTAEAALLDSVRWELSTMGARGVTATAKDGEVTLKGTIASGQELARIAKRIQALAGVRAVIPEIDVKG